MSQSTAEDQIFDNIDFLVNTPSFKEYEYCQFKHCNFASANLSGFRFVDCTFLDCDLSNAKLTSTTLNDICFIDCKLLGLHFENCSDFLFAVSFENCVLNFSSFYGRLLKQTIFKNTLLQEVDFTDANLNGGSFDKCDLTKAVFENTNLEKADFRRAFNYTIDPERNKLKKARFDRMGLSGLLTRYDLIID